MRLSVMVLVERSGQGLIEPIDQCTAWRGHLELPRLSELEHIQLMLYPVYGLPVTQV